MKEKTALEIALGIFATIAGAFGIRDYFQRAIQKTVGPILSPLMDDKRAELLERIRILGDEHGEKLIQLLSHTIHGYSQARLVVLLAKVCENETLAWLNDMEDEQFFTMIEILHHDTIMEWARGARMKDGKIITADVERFKAIATGIVSKIASGAKSTGTAIDDAAEKAAPTIGKFADWLEGVADNLDKEGKK
jgi:hypothetical protein